MTSGAKKKKFKKNTEKTKNQGFLPRELKQKILGVTMFLFAIIVTLSFFDLAGIAGRTMIASFSFLIGKTIFIVPLILVLAGLVFLGTRYEKLFWPGILAILLLILGISGILTGLNPQIKQGGWLGYFVSWPLLKFFGFWVTQIIFLSVMTIAGLIFWQLSTLSSTLISKTGKKEKLEEEKITKESRPLVTRVFSKMLGKPKFEVKELEPKPQLREEQMGVSPVSGEPKTKEALEKSTVFDYQRPPLDLFESDRGGPTSGDTRVNAAIIKKTLQNFDISVEMSEINIGPTVTQYTFKPAEGVKLAKITALSNDLALALASHPIRIEAPIPGRPLVGVEVPNKIRAQVRLRDLISNSQFQDSPSELLIVLGRDVSGNPVYADLSKMPHLLVAGSTGSGKTIFLNDLILSLLYRNSPEILRFILVDPKRVEFPVYNEIPHLLTPVIYDGVRTCNVLKWLISEMERRFDILSTAKARDIGSYNKAVVEKAEILPYIVLIIDELADLMAAKGKEVEAGIVRLAQMSRAVGIHLVVATQRPSVEVITGLIKANITSRITFQVASQVDSRTVLDAAGAEKLLGSGDMLYLSAEVGKPRRIQGVFVSDKEVKKVANWIKTQSGREREEDIIKDELAGGLESTLELPETRFEDFYGGQDLLYEEAKRVVLEAKKASASLLQRRLRIGYARAARLIDMLEEKGVVGPGEGAKPREVYLPSEENLRS